MTRPTAIDVEVEFNAKEVKRADKFRVKEEFVSHDKSKFKFQKDSILVAVKQVNEHGNLLVDHEEFEKTKWVKSEDFNKLEMIQPSGADIGGDAVKDDGVDTESKFRQVLINKDLEEENPPPYSSYEVFSRCMSLNSSISLEWHISLIAGLLNGCCMPLFAPAFKYAVDWLAEIENHDIDPSKGKMPDTAFQILAMFACVGTAAGLFGFIQFSFFHRLGTKISCEMRKQYYKGLLKQDQTYFDNNSSTQLGAYVGTKAQEINNGMGTQLGLTLQHLGEFIAGFGYGFYVSWKISLVLLAMTPVLLLVGMIQGMMTSSMTAGGEDEFSKSIGESAEVLGGMRTVKSLNSAHHHLASYAKSVDVVQEARRKQGWVTGFGVGLFLFCTFAVLYAGGLFYGAFQVEAGTATAGDVFGAFFGVLIGGMGLGQIAASLPDTMTGLAAANLYFRIIDREPQMRKPSTADGKGLEEGIHGQIEFVDLKFAYPTRPDVDVYKKLNLKIEIGQTVAFVGPSGCGKSTIVNLLERFYDPKEGKILIDGNEIHEYDLEYLRSQISLVSQEPVLFDLTIAENIRLGATGEVSQADIEVAAKKANAHNFIENEFPKQYETRVGEKGGQISGGQKQRVAIARGVLKQPKIILLDEATSALDTESEKVVQQALDKLVETESCTCLVIAHRLSTIQHADVIIVLEKGEIQEIGNHEELLEMEGTYARMIEAQRVFEEMEPEAFQDIFTPNAFARQSSFSSSQSKSMKV